VNPGELRTSSRLVASVITIGPYALMGYGVVSSLLTWTLGGVSRTEFGLAGSLFTAALCIPPTWFGGSWFASSAYGTLAYGAWILIGISVIHILIAVGLRGSGGDRGA
jgi:hypothetical protein